MPVVRPQGHSRVLLRACHRSKSRGYAFRSNYDREIDAYDIFLQRGSVRYFLPMLSIHEVDSIFRDKKEVFS